MLSHLHVDLLPFPRFYHESSDGVSPEALLENVARNANVNSSGNAFCIDIEVILSRVMDFG